MLSEDTGKSEEIIDLFRKNGFDKYEISFACIDLKNPKPKIFGYNMGHFIYPASVYKIFIGAEILSKIKEGDFSFDQIIEIESPNDVDKDAKIFPGDTRPLLKAGDKTTINQLLDLMLTRSDNTSSNTLIDLVGRENINKDIINKYNWNGSGITRKFLDRNKEDKSYQFSLTTLSCARHLAEFFYLIEKAELINPFVSRKMKEYMLRWNRAGKQGLNFSKYKEYYRKGGWLETNLWQNSIISAIRNIFLKRWAIIRWDNDAGVITGQNSHYIIALLTVTKSIFSTKYFPIEKFAEAIFKLQEKKYEKY